VCRSVSEVAGLWPDPKALRFGKQEVHGEWLARLGSDNLVLCLQGNAGLLVPWGRDHWNRSTNISERWVAPSLVLMISVKRWGYMCGISCYMWGGGGGGGGSFGGWTTEPHSLVRARTVSLYCCLIVFSGWGGGEGLLDKIRYTDISRWYPLCQ